MNVIIRDLDKTRIHYEAALHRVGEKKANRAFGRALNSEGQKVATKVKRALRKQTGAKLSEITRALRIERASVGNMRFMIIAKDDVLTLKHFNPKQFSYGVRANPWGRSQRFPHAFIVTKLNNNVYKRKTSKRFPIRVMYGPSIPKELLKDASRQAFEQAQPNVLKEATRQLDLMLAGKIK